MNERHPLPIKTIFITSFHGLVSRILEGGIVEMLVTRGNVRVVILVPEFKKDYFCEVFKTIPDVEIEGVPQNILPKRAYLFQNIAFMLLNTKTTRLIRQSPRGYHDKPLTRMIVQTIAGVVGRWRSMHKLFRYISSQFSGGLIFDHYFEKYTPTLVFSTDVKNVFDTQLIIEAKKRGIQTIGMVRSWDYLTAKGAVRVVPDKLIVHNQIIKEEAKTYMDMKEDTIHVVGIPHFDPYTNVPRSSREEFFRRIGVDPQKRLILLAPFGDKFANVDKQFFKILSDAIEEGTLPSDLEVLVRLPPGDTVETSTETFPHIFFDAPGVHFHGKERKANEMSYEDILHLANSLYYSEVILTGPSTIAIDATALDKPTIFLVFDGNEKYPYNISVRHYYDFLHMQNVIQTGSTRQARNREELFAHIQTYLDNQTLEQQERKRVVHEQCWKLDGLASKRVTDVLLSNLS